MLMPSGVRVWLAVGRSDMRRGMRGLALQVQESLGRDPHAGDLYVFRGRDGSLIKILWHDGIGMSLYARRLEHGRFVWPSATDGVPNPTPCVISWSRVLFANVNMASPAAAGPQCVAFTDLAKVRCPAPASFEL